MIGRSEYGLLWEYDGSSLHVEFTQEYDPVRSAVLRDWQEKVVLPVVEEGLALLPSWDWRNEFVQYSILRTLALFELGSIDVSDRALITSLIARLYGWLGDNTHELPRVGRM